MPRSLKDFIAVYDNHLPPALCQQMIEVFEKTPERQHRNGAGVREGLEHSSWTELDVSQLAEPPFLAHFERLLAEAFQRYMGGLALPQPLSPVKKFSELMMKRYRASTNERFQVHFDSIHAHSNRYLVFLWYLNDVALGGETWFPDLDLFVAPRRGRLLIFPPYWMFQHAGLPPREENKYIVSGYAIY